MNGLKAIMILTALAGAALLAAGLWIPAKAALAYGLLDRAYNSTAAADTPRKPWSWADFAVIAKLQVGGETLHVLDRATGQAMAFGAGRHEEYQPDGPLVLSGHRDTHFAVLEHVKPGDLITYATAGGAVRYAVTETRVFDVREGIIHPPGSGEILLITCWPFGAIDPDTPKRYLVLARQQ